jgi:hypothetical protein
VNVTSRRRGVGASVLLWLVNSVAVAVIVIAWWGSATTTALGRETMWLEVAVGALLLASAADIGWLVTEGRAVSERRAVLREILMRVVEPFVGSTRSAAHVRIDDGSTALVSTDGLTMFHRDDCPMVVGRNVFAASRAAHESSARRACGMCRP